VTPGEGDRWDEIDRLFDQALDVPAPERAAWLDRACAGDPGCRQQVEALLQADEAAGRFLEGDALRWAGPSLDESDGGAADSRRIGPYRIVRELARGGMGVVYLAERSDGQFEQRVALKLIKRGMDSDQIHRRFLAERQILARLGHPHIARLLDGGVSNEGQPYFAIEYVEGTTILDHCDAHRLRLEERLRLFLEVCDAVGYAHQNLVVHRDLKPSNILVTPDGQVKLLDFGIAKVIGEDPGAETGLTETGLRVMTPEYAAPEQVRGEPITTATDVYALGAVLYELVSGQRAHRLASRTPSEVERVICQVDPEAPSAAATGADRQRLRGDIDTITLTALKKEPDRRYATVEQLAGDVRRHLDGLPVTARPDNWRYRASKFVGRHRLGVAAAAVLALSIVAGLAGTIWQARVAAERERAAAAERDFLVQLFEGADPGQQPGHELTASELLTRGRRSIDTTLAGQPAVRAELLTILGTVHRTLGLLPQADTLLGQAVALTRRLPGNVDRELSGRLSAWADILVDRDENDRADTVAREAMGLQRRLPVDDTARVPPLRSFSNVKSAKGDYAEAEALVRQALAIDLRYPGVRDRAIAEDLNLVGYVQYVAGNLRGADSSATAALEILRRLLPPDHPSLLEALGNLATLRAARGNFREAEPLAREVLEGRRRVYPKGHPDVAFAMGELAYALQGEERYAEAESLYMQALEMYRSLLGPDDGNTLRVEQSLAFLHYREGDMKRAEPGMRESVAHYRRVAGPDDQYTLLAMVNLSNVLREVGKYGEAEAVAREALARGRKALGSSSLQVAYGLLSLGGLEQHDGNLDEAERLLREALATERTLFPVGHFEIARVLNDVGSVVIDRGRPDEAEPLLREALAARLDHFGRDHPETSATRRHLSDALALERRYAEADTLLLEAYRGVAARSDYWSAKEKRECLRRLVDLSREEGRPGEAVKYQRLMAAADK